MTLMDVQKKLQQLPNEKLAEFMQKIVRCGTEQEIVALFKEYGLEMDQELVQDVFKVVKENEALLKKQGEDLTSGYIPPDVEITEGEMDQLHGEGYIFIPVAFVANANVMANVNAAANANLTANANLSVNANVAANANVGANANTMANVNANASD